MTVLIRSKISKTERNHINNNYCRSSRCGNTNSVRCCGGFVNTDDESPTENRRTCIVFCFLFYFYAEKIEGEKKTFTKNVSKSIANARGGSDRGAPTYILDPFGEIRKRVALPFGGRGQCIIYTFFSATYGRRRSSEPIAILGPLLPGP